MVQNAPPPSGYGSSLASTNMTSLTSLSSTTTAAASASYVNPSLMDASASAATIGPPPPAQPPDEFNPDAAKKKHKKQMLIIISVKCVSLFLCAIVIFVGILGINSSPAYKATMEDQEKCQEGIEGSHLIPSSSYYGYGSEGYGRVYDNWYNGRKVKDPPWLTKYKWFEALSGLTLIFGLLTLSVYACLEGTGKFHKGWPCDVVMQVIHALLIIGAGVVLIMGLEEVFEEGKTRYFKEAVCPKNEIYSGQDEAEIMQAYNSRNPLNESEIASNEEIRSLVNYPVIMTAAVLAFLTTFSFIALVVLVIMFHPTGPKVTESYPTEQGGPGGMQMQQQQSQMSMMNPQQGGSGYPLPQGRPMNNPQQPQMVVVMPTVYGGANYQPYGSYGTYSQQPLQHYGY